MGLLEDFHIITVVVTIIGWGVHLRYRVKGYTCRLSKTPTQQFPSPISAALHEPVMAAATEHFKLDADDDDDDEVWTLPNGEEVTWIAEDHRRTGTHVRLARATQGVQPPCTFFHHQMT